jgi:CNT family concentrative nucleoside transporter
MLIGIPLSECATVASLIGERMVLNEFVSYIHLADLIKEGAISERSAAIATYALCGFANFSSIAIQIGGIGELEPTRRKDFARLGFRAMLGGTFACFMTASIASLLI